MTCCWCQNSVIDEAYVRDGDPPRTYHESCYLLWQGQEITALRQQLTELQERAERAETDYSLIADNYKDFQRDVASWKAMHDTKHAQGCDPK